MAWPTGKPRPPTAGRRKGTPNKISSDIIQTMRDLGHDPAAEHIKLFRISMDDYKRKKKQKNEWGAGTALTNAISANADLMRYVYPVQKAVEHTGKDGGPIAFTTYNDLIKALGGELDPDDDEAPEASKKGP